MSWIDIAIISVVVLCGLIGVLRGFKKSLLSVGVFIVSFLLAFFLANVMAEALLGIDGVKNFVLGNGKFGSEGGFSLANWIYTSASNGDFTISTDSYLGEHFFKPILEIMSKSTVAVDPAIGLSIYMAFLMFSGICGVGIFIVVRLILIVVTTIVKSYIGKRKSAVSRLGGFLIGAVHGAAWAFVFTLVFSCYGGLTFSDAFNNIEKEYEHQSAVFCGYFNDGAYGMRNSMFLPDANMYGRVVNLVIKPETPPDPNEEKLTGERLKLFINISNLNYEESPWTIDPATQKRKFDDTQNKLRDPSDYAMLGYEDLLQAIFDYNDQVASIVDDITKLTEVKEAGFEAYNIIVLETGGSIYNKLIDLDTALMKYRGDYLDAPTEGTAEIEKYNNTVLSNDFNAVNEIIESLNSLYSNFEADFGEFPDIMALIPERVSAGPKPDAPTGGDSEETSSDDEGTGGDSEE